MHAVGEHILVDFYTCQSPNFDDCDYIRLEMTRAAKRMGADIVGVHVHAFNPVGISGVVVISQSHLTIHTWPEYSYAAVDIFTCGDEMELDLAIESLRNALGARTVRTRRINRGQLDPEGRMTTRAPMLQPE